MWRVVKPALGRDVSAKSPIRPYVSLITTTGGISAGHESRLVLRHPDALGSLNAKSTKGAHSWSL